MLVIRRRSVMAWARPLVLGAGLGALILGGGGRLAMRGITLWEGRPHQFSARGTLTVLGFGAAFGLIGAGLRAALDVAAERWRPAGISRRARAAALAVACFALALLVLTPLTVHRLVLFPPVVALYVLALEGCWRPP